MSLLLPRPLDLPEFPWDQLAPAKARAAEHPGGLCDLSVGTPVDDTPDFIREALADAGNAHGYPTRCARRLARGQLGAGWLTSAQPE